MTFHDARSVDAVCQFEIDTVEAPQSSKAPLRLGDVQHREALSLGGCRQRAGNDIGSGAPADLQNDGVAYCEARGIERCLR